MAEGGSSISRGLRYFSESFEELKKVSAPTRQETVEATLVTALIVIFIAVVVACMDLIFRQVMGALLS